MHNSEEKRRDELISAVCGSTACHGNKCPGHIGGGRCRIVDASIEDIIVLVANADETWIKHRMEDRERFAVVVRYLEGRIVLE